MGIRDRLAKLFNFSSTESKRGTKKAVHDKFAGQRQRTTEPLPSTGPNLATLSNSASIGAHSLTANPQYSSARQDEVVARIRASTLASTSSTGDAPATTATTNAVPGVDIFKLDSKAMAQLTVEQRDQVLEELLKALEQGDAAQQASAAEALFNATSEDEISRQKISAMGVVRPLVALLKQEDVKGQMYAAYTLSALTSIEMSRADMRECHAIRALVDVLNTSTNTVSRKGAMRALGRLARNDDCAVDIVRLGGLAPVVSLLRSDDSTLVRRCLIALYFIGADKPDMQRAIADADAIPDVLKLCDSPRPDVQAEAADVMKVLARSLECAAIINRLNGLLVLQRVAQEGEHPKSRTCAVKALQRLAEVAEYRQSIIRTGGQGLLEVHTETEAEQLAMLLYRSGDQDAQSKALKAVADAVAEDPGVAQSLADAGVVEPLVIVLEKASAELRCLAAVALSRMAQDADVRKRMWAAEAVPPLVRGLRELTARGTEAAAGALEKLASLREAAEQMVKEPVVGGLLFALDTGGDVAQASAVRTVYLLCGVQPSVLQDVAKLGGVQVLTRRFWQGSAEVQAVALAIMKDLCRVHSDAVIQPGSGAVIAMIALQNSSVDDLARLAGSALEELEARAAGPVRDERARQALVQPMLAALARSVGAGNPLPRVAEEALRHVPRGLYLEGASPSNVYSNREAMLPRLGLRVEPPEVALLVLSKLRLTPGQQFLDIGCGSGFLTTLAAYIVGPQGSALGIDTSERAVAYAQERAGALQALNRCPGAVPRFEVKNCGVLIEGVDTWHAVHVGGELPQVWIKTLLKLLKPKGRLVACMNGQMHLFEEGKSTTRAPVIGNYCYEAMLPQRRRVRGLPTGRNSVAKSKHEESAAMRHTGSHHHQHNHNFGSAAANNGAAANSSSTNNNHTPGNASNSNGGNAAATRDRTQGSGAKESSASLAPRIDSALLGQSSGGKPHGGGGTDSEEAKMAAVQREIEEEQMNGLLMTMNDIDICRNAEGRKCRLGEGGFGVVYKALMNGVDEVAVKLVKADKPTAKDMELFLKEVRTLAKLHHRNIVQFYGACLNPNSAMFFVTELMKGGDLYSALRHHPDTMRWDKLGKKVALDVALGVNYLHTRRPPLLHRDLKSPNVLLSEEGVAKIADVGMVRSQVKELVTAQPVMTPLWAAPEVMRHERASVKADIWSYGILVWELISGADITEYQPLAISRQMGPSNKGKVMVLPPNCPTVARKIFERCTVIDPHARPTSMDIVEWLRDA